MSQTGTSYIDPKAFGNVRENTGRVRVGANNTKARRIADPFEKTAEYTLHSKTAERRTGVATKSFAEGKLEARMRTTPFESGAYKGLYERCADIRAAAYSEQYTRAHAEKTGKSASKKKQKRGFLGTLKRLIGFGWLVDDRPSTDDVGISAPRVSLKAVVTIIIAAFLLFVIILSLDSINSFKQEIADIDSKCEEVNSDIAKLTLRLDRKEDIRTVEKIAKEDLGMIDSTNTEIKYITLSGGDRVEVTDEAGESYTDAYAAYATALSAPATNWGKILDYIK